MAFFEFYKGKKVLVTGATGFKGSWLCEILLRAGADVCGYSLDPPTDPNLFSILSLGKHMRNEIADVRDYARLESVFQDFKPQVVFHLAAQPLVLDSYERPRYTYEVNVMGTVNVLECVRKTDSVRSFLNVTTDKVYRNDDIPDHPFAEDEPLDGYDPYSNSKSCSELVTHSYGKSFFYGKRDCAISTARAGNVIGGGDFAGNRIVPDCARAMKGGRNIELRNPDSTRPYQHVLEPLFAYLLIAQKQYDDIGFQGCYNVGPDDEGCYSAMAVAETFIRHSGADMKWIDKSNPNAPHEAAFLKLDNSKLKSAFGWNPTWNLDKAIEKSAEWYVTWIKGGDLKGCVDRQIDEFAGAWRF